MAPPSDPHVDAVIVQLIVEAETDPDVIGLVLLGSRSVGDSDAESDYDVTFVVTDAAMERYQHAGQLPPRGHTIDPPIDTTDVGTAALSRLDLRHLEAWQLPAWANARVLYDRTGETTRTVDALRFIPEERAWDETARWYDTYLNAVYRSLKAWRRGNALGGRLEAAESASALVHTLFALERRWCPYSSRLVLHLGDLAGQGWDQDDLRAILLALTASGDPHFQQQIARRVVVLLRDRGFDQVLQDWHGQIEHVLNWSFT